MTTPRDANHGETPTIEVRVYRDGRLIERELCESEERAALVVEAWQEIDGVECEVDDLSVRHGPEDILSPEAPELEEEYPAAGQNDPARGRDE